MRVFLAIENPSYLDTLAGGALILFLLSLINEKLIEFIRNHISFPKVLNPFNWLRTINVKRKGNKRFSQKQEREIRMLSIVSGVIIAIIAKASLFSILSSPDPQKELFWNNGFTIGKEPHQVLGFIFGVLFTGFFLSFGSKFFHDLLDIFCQIKNTKRQLSGEDQERKSSENNDSEFSAKVALRQQEKTLKAKYGSLMTLETGITSSNQYGLVAYLSNPEPNFPTEFKVSAAGKNVVVPVETIVDKTVTVHYGLNCRASNVDYIDIMGAFGGVVVSGEDPTQKLMLTCSHVALGGKGDDLGGYAPNGDHGITVRILDNGKPKALGSVIYARCDTAIDAALISLPQNYLIDWNNQLPDGNVLGDVITMDDLKEKDDVSFYSARIKDTVSGTIQKKVSDHPFTLKYDDGTQRQMPGLIVIGNNNSGSWNTISEKGDSGSILFDSNYNPFGLLVGGNSDFTFAIPLSEILQDTGTEIH